MRKATKTSGRRAKTRTSNLVRITKQQELKKKAQRITQAKTIRMAYESAIKTLQKISRKSGKAIKPDTYEKFKNVVFSQYNTVKKIISFRDSVADTKRIFINEYAAAAKLGTQYWRSQNQIDAVLRSEGWRKLAAKENVILTAEFLQNTSW